MSSRVEIRTRSNTHLSNSAWLKLGLLTALISIVAVLVVQAIAIVLWPEIALFAPLNNYARTAVFVLVPVMVATYVLAWLVGRNEQGVQRFMTISFIVLLVSIIPDYVLPVPDKTVLASSVTAFLHVVTALITVGMLVYGYQRRAGLGG